MKIKSGHWLIALALPALFTLQPSTARAQGTAFTYQGRLNDAGVPASGSYDFRFRLASDPLANNYVGSADLTNGLPVMNGLFTTTLDFGPGVLTGSNYWLEVDVRTNGAGSYTVLAPLQALTPTPYAIMANSASNLLGTVPVAQLSGPVVNSQLANNSITVNAGAGLSGGGAVALGGATTLNNAGVTALTGGGGVTVSAANGAVTLGSTATSADTANAIVSRDASGNFSAGNITLAGILDLPGVPVTITFGGNSLLYADANDNFFIGPFAGHLTTSGGNTAVGSFVLGNDTSGSYNTANGYAALAANTSGSQNTANGADALYSNTIGTQNTANGFQALYFNTSGSQNTAAGMDALLKNTTGSFNTANGVGALNSNTNGYNNTASGFQALFANTSGWANEAFGYWALENNLSGYQNVAVGDYALIANTNGDQDTAVGSGALQLNVSGSANTAEGFHALFANTSGSDNVANGYQALYNNTLGGYNTANGCQALYSNIGDNVGNGWNNTAVGDFALWSSTSGSGNIALGTAAGDNFTGSESDNIDIGNGGVVGDNNIIRIGTQGIQTSAFLAGIYGTTAASGVPVYVNSSGQLGVLSSSQKYKRDIQPMGDASDALLALQPVTFKYKSAIDPSGTPEFGLVAEQVDKVDPALVVHDPQHGIYTVRYQAVDAMLLNEFLKEHRTVEEQNMMLQELSQKVDAQNFENAELKQRLEALERIILNQK